MSEVERERVGRLPEREKLAMAIEMTDAMAEVCKAGIRARFPGITEAQVQRKFRERLEWAKKRSGHDRRWR